MTAMRCTLCGWVDSHDPACMWIGPRDPAYLVPISDEEAEARLSAADLRAALVVVREQLTQAQGRLAIVWEEGYTAGVEDEARWENTEKARPDTPNPYADRKGQS